MPSDLMQAPALVTRTKKGPKAVVWEDIVLAYGNTFGVHLSGSIPDILDDVRFMGLAQTDFGTFMLRSLAVLTSDAGHRMVQALDPGHSYKTHPVVFQGVKLFQAQYQRIGTQDDVRAQIEIVPIERDTPIRAVRRPEGNLSTPVENVTDMAVENVTLRRQVTSL